MKKINFTIKLERPHCRTPIPVRQKHKIDTKYARKPKHKRNNDDTKLVQE